MITILGPTACGKTKFAAHLAARLNGEIISADSRQVYRGMDIGTGKDLADYIVDGKPIPYHLIDIAEPGERYNVFRFQRDFLHAYESIVERGKQPILCGGTGLYIESIVRHYQFEQGEDIEPSPYWSELEGSLIVGLKIDRELRRQRISERLRQRLDEGMVDEIRHLLSNGVSSERLIRYGLEYKYLTLHVIEKLSYDEMVRLLEIAIHQFAKRQMTYFRGMEERRGVKIHWIDATLSTEEKIEICTGLLSSATA
ncbi:MAG: tRNA (adenosine(37)-N6)-dimethylallyltransferase MiaA [Bacteroidaceae bacterium]|nr:tRNA (adenosine(37)-N6)-dimethylallyltransferase MiaA [Bacteroidaceae bacterium]